MRLSLSSYLPLLDSSPAPTHPLLHIAFRRSSLALGTPCATQESQPESPAASVSLSSLGDLLAWERQQEASPKHMSTGGCILSESAQRSQAPAYPLYITFT